MRQRKSYPKSFKTQVVQECEQPGVSVASTMTDSFIRALVSNPVSGLLTFAPYASDHR